MITSAAIELSTPDVGQLGDVVRAIGDRQHEASPMQLHPGDLGWYRQFGAKASATNVVLAGTAALTESEETW